MLNGFNLLIIGGDDRYVEVIHQLENVGVNIQISGFEKLTTSTNAVYKNDLSEVDFKSLDAILLPVSGTNDEGKVELAPFSDNQLFLTQKLVKKTPDYCTIYTGISSTYLDQLSDRTNRKLVRLFKRDDMAILNSIPTAEGTLEIAMKETETMIHGSRVLVLGFGRVGLTIARLFSVVGAHVSVGTRNSADLARCSEMQLSSVKLEKLHDEIRNYDIIINTIPHQVIDSHILSVVEDSTLIIDLASATGGVDFETAKKKGIKAIHALGLPGKVAPVSAGKIIADVLIELLKDQ